MIQTLDGMFAKSNSAARQVAIRVLMNTRMIGGSVAGSLPHNDITSQSSRSDEGKTGRGNANRHYLVIPAR